ncbi:hypothetical protein IFM89_003756, partial [Coptis chinensis]
DGARDWWQQQQQKRAHGGAATTEMEAMGVVAWVGKKLVFREGRERGQRRPTRDNGKRPMDPSINLSNHKKLNFQGSNPVAVTPRAIDDQAGEEENASKDHKNILYRMPGDEAVMKTRHPRGADTLMPFLDMDLKTPTLLLNSLTVSFSSSFWTFDVINIDASSFNIQNWNINYGVDKYDIGAGFGHFGVAVEDVAKTVDLVKAKGGKVTREPGPVKGGNTVIAFVEDPDGYKFELLERGPTPEPLCQLMLRVGDLDRAIQFYEKAFGMELLRKRDNPEYKYTIAMMGYGPEDKNVVLELTYNYGVTEYDKGNAYAQIAIGTDDVYKTAAAIKLYGGKIMREPGPLPGINTKITACLDPDGWKSVFVDNIDFLKELE